MKEFLNYLILIKVLFTLSSCGVIVENDIVSLKKKVEDMQVQEYLNNWVLEQVINDLSWKNTAEYGLTNGIGDYRLYFPKFDWSVLNANPKLGHFQLIGTLEKPSCIVIYGVDGRLAILYSLDGKNPAGTGSIEQKEVVPVNDNIYLFNPHRGN